MPKSKAPRIISHIPQEHQQEAILNAVLNIEAHTMTMAGMLLNIETSLIVSKEDSTKGYPALEFYKQSFSRNFETMQKRYSSLGKIDMI